MDEVNAIKEKLKRQEQTLNQVLEILQSLAGRKS
jgi:hypothetical protein